MTADSSRQVQLAGTGSGVHGDGLSDDEAIGDQLADGLAGVGVGDLADLIGVEPDLALAASEDVGREALLGSEIDPVKLNGENLLSASKSARNSTIYVYVPDLYPPSKSLILLR